MDSGLWFLRVALMSIGSALAAQGIGDEAMWQVVIGGVLNSVGAAWSYVARQQALKAVPK